MRAIWLGMSIVWKNDDFTVLLSFELYNCAKYLWLGLRRGLV